jgi:hypothetical protein
MIGERLALPRGIEPYFSLERAAPRGGGDDLELVIGVRRHGRMSFKDSILPAPDQWWQIELPRVPTRVSTVGLHRPNSGGSRPGRFVCCRNSPLLPR